MNRENFLALIAASVVVTAVEPFGEVRLKQLTEPQVTGAREASGKDNADFCRRLVVMSLIDENDAPILFDADLPALASGAFGPIDALVGAVLKANRIGQAESAVKN